MAIDFGSKRVGIAVSDESKKFSFSREHIINDKNLIPNILDFIKKENIEKIVIGYPLNLKSEKTAQTLETEQFSVKLKNHLTSNSIKAEIVFIDERFTSRIAQYNILSSGLSKKKRKDKGMTDSISAQILLQDYIDNVNQK
jgi:putative holliday junction resolvase